MDSNEFMREMQLSARTAQLEAKVAFGEFILGSGDWKIFWTQTFRPPGKSYGDRATYTRRGYSNAWRQWDRLVEFASAEVGDKCRTFSVMELHESGVPHIHALLGRSRGGRRWAYGDCLSELAKRLEAHATELVGFSKVRVLNLEGGATWYCCKYCVKGYSEWRLSEE